MKSKTVTWIAAVAALTTFASPGAKAQLQFTGPTNYAVGSSPSTVITGDFNGDGRLDQAVLNTGDHTVSILLGNGDGTFQPAISHPVDSNAHFIAAGDFNGDGKLDLAVANTAANTVSILLGNGDGTFQAAVEVNIGSYADFVAMADFNNDGKMDLVVSYSGNNNGTPPVPSTIFVLLGNGDGTFQNPKALPVAAVPMIVSYITTGDFNGDGNSDIAAGESAGPGCPLKGESCLQGNVVVFLGNGDGTFQAPVKSPVNFGPVYFSTGDLNGDGKADLVLGGLETFNSGSNLPAARMRLIATVLGNGDGTFGTPIDVATLPGSVPLCKGEAVNGNILAADLNGDGHLDLITSVTEFTGTCGSPTPSLAVWTFLGNGDGTFQSAQQFNLTTQPGWLAVGDFVTDALPSFAVSSPSTNNVSVFLNTTPGIVVSILPESSTVKEGGTQGLTATVTNDPKNLGVTWTIKSACDFGPACRGTFTQTSPTSATYAAPANFAGQVTVVATSVADLTKSASASVTITPTAPLDFSLSPTSASLTGNRGAQVTDTLTITPQNGPFTSAIQLSCAVTGSTPLATCSLSSASVTPGPNAATSTLTITTPTQSARLTPSGEGGPSRPLYALLLPMPLALIGFGLVSRKSKQQRRQLWLLCSIFIAFVVLLAACGGGSSNGPPPSLDYTVTVTAISGAIQHSTAISVTVQ